MMKMLSKNIIRLLLITSISVIFTGCATLTEPNEVNISHILLKLPNNPTREQLIITYRRMNSALQAIKAGKSFGQAAFQMSECPTSKGGGNLGWVKKGQTVPEFENVAFSLKKPGDMSDIIRTRFGLHVIRLNERR